MVNIPTSHGVFLSSELEIAVVKSLSAMILINQLSSSLMSKHWYMPVFRPLEREGPGSSAQQYRSRHHEAIDADIDYSYRLLKLHIALWGHMTGP